MLAVKLLGGLSLEGEQSGVARPAAQRHRLALLALLALAHPRGTSRHRLMAYLWPDRDEAHARNLLKQAVHALRKALGEGAILSAGDELRLDAGLVACDLLAFEAALATRELERAVGLYTGPLLDGFHLPNAAEFEQRMDVERDRLRRRFVEALETLAEQAAARRDWVGAVAWRRRVAAEEPYSGLVTVRLMEALDASGDRAGAINQARLHALLLQQQFEAAPDEQVVALAERLRTEPAGGEDRSPAERPRPARPPRGRARVAPFAPHRRSPSYPLVGRAAEWERLRAAWAATAAGASHFALITGEAGIGKTRLAEELLEWAGREGIDVARTRSYAAEGQLAYAPVTDWLRAAALQPGLEALDTASLAEVARLVPELREGRPDLPAPEPLTESWQRQRLFTGITRTLLAGRDALMLVIDDLQWCDQDTLQWLHYLLRFETDARLLVIGTARADEVPMDHPLTTFVHDLRRRDQATEIVLCPLDADATAILASQVAGRALPADAAAHLYRETEGHPLFVVESVRVRLLDPVPSGVAESDALPAPGAAAVGANGSLPPHVQAVIHTRLAQLSPAARRVAGVAATIGRDFTLAVLSRACDPSDGTPLDSLDELWQRRIIREHDAGRFDFSHDKLREVAYAAMGPVRRRVLHRRVAEALRLQHDADLDAVGGQIAGHYERGGLPEAAIPFHARAAEAAKRIYANEEAIGHLERALALLATLPRDDGRDRRELALRIALLPPLRVTRGWASPALGECAARARSLCDHVGTDAERFRVTSEMVSFQFVRGTNFRAALETAEEALGLAAAQDDPSLLTPAHHWVGITHCHRAEFAAAREHLERATALYDRRHHQGHVLRFGTDFGVFSHAFASHAHWHLGHADRAVRLSRQALELSEELTHPFSRTIALAYDAMLQQFLGDVEAVAAQAAALLELSARQGFPYYHAWGTILEGWAIGVRHDADRGVARLRDGLAAMRATGAHVRRSYYLSLLAELSARTGEVEPGLALLDEALRFAQETGEHWKDAELHRLRGELLLARPADEHEAEDAFRRAAEIARRQDARLLELRAAVSLGRLLQRRQRRAEAREMLAEARAWFTEGFGTADLRQADALLGELS